MSTPNLPERASLEYLKKLAKERLRELRGKDPSVRLAAVQLEIAREQGFSSWRALRAAIEKRSGDVAAFFDGCTSGDLAVLERLVAGDPGLVRVANPAAQHGGWTGLHTAAQRGQLEVVRLLLRHGADPNAREAGDNTYALHWAAANRNVEMVRVLLDAGTDVHGVGDDHALDVIGWGTFFHEPGGAPGGRPEVAALLVERGARHHIFSAISIGDLALIRGVVARDSRALDRRMSRFEGALTPMHFAISRKRYDIVDMLVSLGVDLEAKDGNGHTALETAMLHGDREAMTRLMAAGARQPARGDASGLQARMAKLGESVGRQVPMIYVPDVAAALDWYVSIGFREIARFGDDGLVNFGMVAMGKAEIMLNMHGKQGRHDVSLWLYTDRIDEIYELLKARQMEAALTGAGEGIAFEEHINDTFYRARQFAIRDLNGYVIYFIRNLG